MECLRVNLKLIYVEVAEEARSGPLLVRNTLVNEAEI